MTVRANTTFKPLGVGATISIWDQPQEVGKLPDAVTEAIKGQNSISIETGDGSVIKADVLSSIAGVLVFEIPKIGKCTLTPLGPNETPPNIRSSMVMEHWQIRTVS